MEGPFHEFYLITKTDLNKICGTNIDKLPDYEEVSNNFSSVQITDDFINYINDYIKWVPSFFLSNNQQSMGLNIYGPTLICKEGGIIFYKICDALIHLFSVGPETIELRGLYVLDKGNPTEGNYERLLFDRNIIINRLKKLLEWTQTVSEKKDYYLLHMGI